MKEADFWEYLNAEKEGESIYIGIEEQEEDSEEDGMPYNVQNIRVEQKMITIFQIEHWIQQGILNLKPEYQRNLVWDYKRKSALIESLMLKIPIPAFYLDEGKGGIKSVIDGMQRLSAIHEFLNDGFSLCNMQYLSACEKQTFSQLNRKFRTYIEDTTLSINILDERCPQMVKFDVFRRVNTGGVPLNVQEIRNVMAVPEVRQFLREMAGCKEFLKATGGKINDVRMGAQELCLRYLTILSCYQWENRKLQHYYGLMKSMDAEILKLNICQTEVLADIAEHFRQVMDLCYLILGEKSFCKPGSRLINKSLFSSWAVVLTRYLNREAEIRKNAKSIFRQYWQELNENMTFYSAITSSTGTKRHLIEALDTVRGIVEENL